MHVTVGAAGAAIADGVQDSPVTRMESVKVSVLAIPDPVAVSVTLRVKEVNAEEEIVKLAELAPACTVTLGGTVSEAELLLSMNERAPLPGLVNATEQVALELLAMVWVPDAVGRVQESEDRLLVAGAIDTVPVPAATVCKVPDAVTPYAFTRPTVILEAPEERFNVTVATIPLPIKFEFMAERRQV